MRARRGARASMTRASVRLRSLSGAVALGARALGAVALGVVLTGCGSDAGAGSSAGNRQSSAAAAPDLSTPSTSAGSPKAPADSPKAPSTGGSAARTPAAPKLPRSQLSPVTGSFTKPEKEYLVGRVPKGTDPVAVLETGQETCERIARTVRHDRAAVIGALRAGEIPGAEDAVRHLCPEHEPLLEAAGKGGTG
ncbi:hypothetical protein AB0C51_20350 [Streptomyces pathocidini]|uniref:hypothetical protein n=1 Tax=Streptomyces pathocidini TaxID=1650571 RepID=UPI00340147AF